MDYLFSADKINNSHLLDQSQFHQPQYLGHSPPNPSKESSALENTSQPTETSLNLKTLADNVLGVLYQFRLHPDGSVDYPYVSAGCREIFELEPEALQKDGKLMINLTHPDDRDRFEQSVAESAQNLTPWSWEGRCILPSGKKIWIKAMSRPQKQEESMIVWDGWILDITEQKNYESALKSSHTRLNTILEGSSEAFFAVDEDWNLTHLNAQSEYLLGKPRPELLGQNLWEMHPNTVNSVFYKKYNEARNTGTAVKFEAYYKPLHAWFEVRAYPSGDELFIFFTNIDTRKHLEKSLQEVHELNNNLESRVNQRTEALQDSEKRLDSILSSLQDVVWSMNPNTFKITYMNPVTEKVYGRTIKDFFKNSQLWLEVVHPEDQQKAKNSLEFLMKQGHKETEYRIVRPDGEVRWVRDRAQFIHDGDGEVVRIDGIITDITDRKIADAEQQKLVSVVESSSDFIGVADMTGQALYVNHAGQKMLGIPNFEAVKQTTMFDYFPPEKLPELQEKVLPTIQKKGRWQGEFEFKHFQTGKIVPVELNIFTINHPETGEPFCYATVTRDITERKEAEAKLRESEKRYQLLAEASPIGVYYTDATGDCLYTNKPWRDMAGLTHEEALGKGWVQALHPEERDRIFQEWYAATAQKIPFRTECRFQRPDGSYSWVISQALAVNNDQGEAIGYVGTITDIHDRKETEAKLLESEKRYQVLAEASPIGVYYTDATGNCRYTNKPWRDMTGLEKQETLGQGWSNALHPEDRETVFAEWAKAAQQKKPFRLECRFKKYDGSYSWVITQALAVENDQGEVTGFVGTVTDISDRKKMEVKLQKQTQDLENTLRELQETQTQLIQSEKMSSLGQLVAGVAHEINNPVNFIYGNLIHIQEYGENLLEIVNTYQDCYPEPVAEVEDILEDLDFDFLQEDFPKMLNSMQMGSKRIREIVASLRNFSRLDEAEYKEADIHEGLENTLMILNNRLKAKAENPAIQVVKNYGTLPKVQCFPGQLNQVFMNILVNALDALEDSNKGKTYKEIEANPNLITITTEMKNDDTVRIVLQDNGKGIPENIKTRIFDPFFTTKSVGKGTGLGMSISYQIITEKHRGKIYCESEIGKGAAFIIEIPLKQNIKD